VASELSRRDRSLFIGLTGAGGSAAQADALTLTNASGLEYQARRCGLGFTGGIGGDFQMSWDRAFGMPSARAVAIALEESQGIHRAEKSPATTPRALGYRLVASMLELTLGDRVEWSTSESRGGPLDPASVATRERLRDWEDTRWALRRAGQPVARLDNFGWLEIDGRLVDLHFRYRELNGRLYPLVLDVLSGLLP
jgi:hypothetical protein